MKVLFWIIFFVALFSGFLTVITRDLFRSALYLESLF